MRPDPTESFDALATLVQAGVTFLVVGPTTRREVEVYLYAGAIDAQLEECGVFIVAMPSGTIVTEQVDRFASGLIAARPFVAADGKLTPTKALVAAREYAEEVAARNYYCTSTTNQKGS